MAAALEADLVAIGKAVRPLTGSARLGHTARALTQGCGRSVLFAVTVDQLGDAVALAYDGSPVAADALDLAARIASDDGGRLLVFLIAGTTEDAAEHEAAVRRRLRRSGLDLAFQRIYARSSSDMLRVMEDDRPRLLVAGVVQESPAGEALARVLEQAACPVLLVRPRG
jgi:nucleotide-binding universal stress UspA family protein